MGFRGAWTARGEIEKQDRLGQFQSWVTARLYPDISRYAALCTGDTYILTAPQHAAAAAAAAARRYNSFPCEIASLIGHIWVAFKSCCPFFPLINIPQPIPEPLTPSDYLDQNTAVLPRTGRKLKQSFLCFSCVMCSYQVSRLLGQSE